MIRYNPKDWIKLIFHNYSAYVIGVLWKILLFMAVFTFLVVYLIVDYFGFQYESTVVIHSLLGIVLGLFLVFRTNSAYDRWWEGRTKWGELVNNTRTLAMKINAFVDPDDRDTRDFFRKMIPNFVYSTKEHLRDNMKPEEIQPINSGFIEELEKYEHRPNKLVSLMYKKIHELFTKQSIAKEHLYILDKEIKTFMDVLGACERIKNTPIPYSYSMYIKKFIFTFSMTLPLGIAAAFQYWTIPIVLLVFYVLVSVELISEEIENPFGKDINDLPTDDLAAKIKANIEEIIE